MSPSASLSDILFSQVYLWNVNDLICRKAATRCSAGLKVVTPRLPARRALPSTRGAPCQPQPQFSSNGPPPGRSGS